MDGSAQSHTAQTPTGQTPQPVATNLRNMLAVATALRRLAQDARARETALYLAAAATLERQAARIASMAMQDQGTARRPKPKDRSGLHQPVDVHI